MNVLGRVFVVEIFTLNVFVLIVNDCLKSDTKETGVCSVISLENLRSRKVQEKDFLRQDFSFKLKLRIKESKRSVLL